MAYLMAKAERMIRLYVDKDEINQGSFRYVIVYYLIKALSLESKISTASHQILVYSYISRQNGRMVLINRLLANRSHKQRHRNYHLKISQ
jgi:hypothetical protein